MSDAEPSVTEERIQRAMGSERRSDIWGLLLMADLTGGAVLFLISTNVGWRDVSRVVVVVTILGGLTTLAGWVVAELRTDRELKALDPELKSIPPVRPSRNSAKRRLGFVGVGVAALVISLVFPPAGRWLFVAAAAGAVLAYAWTIRRASTHRRRQRRQ